MRGPDERQAISSSYRSIEDRIPEDHSLRAAVMTARLVWTLRVIVAAPALLQTFFWRSVLDGDGMSYIDVARNYAAGDFAGAINGYWSPLFSWLIASVLTIFSPSPRHELAVVHMLSFVLFLVALFAFGFFVQELVARLSVVFADETERSYRAWVVLAYAVFGFACVVLHNVGRGGPDFLLAAAFYTALGLLFRISRVTEARPTRAFLLGVVLGLGYLAKAVMLPISIVIAGCATVFCWRSRGGHAAIGALVAGLALTAGPWIAVLSTSKGRLTSGDSARLSYAWYVDNMTIWHWRGDPVHGSPLHPTRLISSESRSPRVFEFAGPVRGTYPVWYDPSYWNDGFRVQPHLRSHVRRLSLSAEDLASQPWFPPMLATLLALSLAAGRDGTRRAWRAVWFVLICAAAGMALYFNVLILPRHIAPFFVAGSAAFLMALASSIHRGGREPGPSFDAVAWALSITFGVMSLAQLVFVDRRLSERGAVQMEVVDRLVSAGIGPGASVGVIGDSMHSYWAQLAHDRIVAEIPVDEAVAYWGESSMRRAELLGAFRKTAAVAVVADNVPAWADTSGWTPIGDTGYLYQRLRRTSATGEAVERNSPRRAGKKTAAIGSIEKKESVE